jgi:MoaA/NifB/PqqE/SkfB family radical SAM enzyme
LLETILDKAMGECTIAGVALFNWTEPLLHPAVHELIGVVRSRAIRCAISTNLNVLRDPALLMLADRIGCGSRFRDLGRRSMRAGTRPATSKW